RCVPRSARADRAARRLDAGDAIAFDADAGDLGVAFDRDAVRLSSLGEADRDAVRIGDAVALAERRAEHPVGAQTRREAGRLRGVEPLHVDAEAALQRRVASERLDALRRREEKE